MEPIKAVREEIAALRNVTYLNWGGSGPSPRRVTESECAAIHELNDEHGPMSFTALKASFSMLERARASLARFLGCKSSEIALVNSTSEAINKIAWGFEWQPGDEVLISDLEHVSGIAPWMYLEKVKGIRLVRARSREGRLDVDQLLDKVTPRTRLVMISHVSYISGATLPIAELAVEAEARGFLLGVDGAQSVGAIPVDPHALGVHFYALPGQKWLLGPDGTGALYVREDMLERMQPSYIGWASLPHERVETEGLRFHASARKYEVGGVRVPSFAALAEAVDTLHDIGIDRIAERIAELRAYLLQRLEASGVTVWGRDEEKDRSGLVSVRLDGVDPKDAVKALWEEHRVVVRWIDTPRVLRFAVHAFNSEEDIDRAVDALRRVLTKVN